MGEIQRCMQSLPQTKYITKICSKQWRIVGFVSKTIHFQDFFQEPAFISWFQVLLLSKLLDVKGPESRPERWAAVPRAHSSALVTVTGHFFLLLVFDTVSLSTLHGQSGFSPTLYFLTPLQPSSVQNPDNTFERLLVFDLISKSFLELESPVLN